MGYYFIHIHKPFQHFVTNGVYWVNEKNAEQIPKACATIYPAEIVKKYANQRTMLLVRSAGIGDIIALSSVCGVADNTIILTQNKYKPLAKYFDTDVTFKGFNEPLFVCNNKDVINKFSSIGMMYGDTDIDNGSRDNWYEIINRSLDLEFDAEYGRPQLKSLTNEVHDVCIIVSKSSHINRTANKHVLENVAKRYFKNVIHADEQKWTFEQYLKALDTARMVISVDTSAIHFREGIGKPALGLYGAFSTLSRTSYYTYTTSIDVESTCDIQPCFRHGGQICKHVNAQSRHAPCLGKELTSNIEQQINAALLCIKF